MTRLIKHALSGMLNRLFAEARLSTRLATLALRMVM